MKRTSRTAPAWTKRARAQVLAKRNKGSSVPRNRITPTVINVGHNTFPDRIINELVYCDQISVSLGLSGKGFYVLSCNGLYDPDITSTGHQCLYFDQMMAIYDQYTVLKSSIEVTPQYTSVTTNLFSWGIYIEDDSSGRVSGGFSACAESPGAVYASCNPIIAGFAQPLRKYWDAVKAFGPNPLANNALEGSASANPTEVQNFYIWVDGGAPYISQSVAMNIKIKYTVTFYERTTIAPKV